METLKAIQLRRSVRRYLPDINGRGQKPKLFALRDTEKSYRPLPKYPAVARDLAVLDGEYKIICVSPYDMFPQTKHVETLVMLERKNP